MSFIAIPTLAGQIALAAAVDPEDPVPLVLSQMVVGDGGGNVVSPIETQTTLVNQVSVVPLAATSRDANKLTIDAILDELEGPYTIREAGILDENGVLMFVASIPATEKMTTAQNVADVLTLGLIVVVSDTAQVQLISEGTTWATHDYVNQAIANWRTNISTPLRPYHVSVKAIAQTVPPVTPAPGDTYLVPADATGAWAGQANKVAQYLGSEIWTFATSPISHVVSNEADGLLYQRLASGWRALLPAVPGQTLWLQSTNDGVKSWTDPFNIKALTVREVDFADDMPFHSAALDLKGKITVGAFADKIAERVAMSDYVHSETFFMGMM